MKNGYFFVNETYSKLSVNHTDSLDDQIIKKLQITDSTVQAFEDVIRNKCKVKQDQRIMNFKKSIVNKTKKFKELSFKLPEIVANRKKLRNINIEKTIEQFNAIRTKYNCSSSDDSSVSSSSSIYMPIESRDVTLTLPYINKSTDRSNLTRRIADYSQEIQNFEIIDSHKAICHTSSNYAKETKKIKAKIENFLNSQIGESLYDKTSHEKKKNNYVFLYQMNKLVNTDELGNSNKIKHSRDDVSKRISENNVYKFQNIFKEKFNMISFMNKKIQDKAKINPNLVESLLDKGLIRKKLLLEKFK